MPITIYIRKVKSKMAVSNLQELMGQVQQIKNKISVLVNEGYLNEASDLVNQMEKIIPADPDIYSIMTAICYHKNDLETAEKIAVKGLMLNPTHFDLLYNLSFILIH
jgi:hypothetical protein